MRFFTSSNLAAAAVAVSTVQGYLLDDSCQGDDRTLVQSMVSAAQEMVTDSLSAVQKSPRSADTDNMLVALFGNADDGAAAVADAFVASGPNNKNEYKGIQSFTTEITDKTTLAPTDVVIYCNQDRLKRMAKAPIHLWDSDGEFAASKTGTDCIDGTFAYTMTKGRKWDVIQVCPWFLQYSKGKKYGTKISIKDPLAKLAGAVDKLVTDKWYTPIDLLSLWDKVMLHEFMHTKAGGTKLDVNDKGGYGWKNCKTLATTDAGQARNNADSYGLFGSAISMINAGVIVNDDGSLVEPGAAPPPRKRSGVLMAKKWLA